MKNHYLLLCSLLSIPAFASGGGASGTVNSSDTARQAQHEHEGESPGGYEEVEDGECHDNDDGVNVCNTGDDGKEFKVSPKSGNDGSATIVDATNDAKGDVSGNDTVNCAYGSDVTISGTGGTVNAGSGSKGSVTNNSATGAFITVNIGGGSIAVPPGSWIDFNG